MTASPPSPPLGLGACATLACLWEATAPKPGNVYRGADFADMTYADFLASAAVIGPVLERCQSLGLGGTVLQAIGATQSAVNTNTNLGTVLLLAPLALSASSGTPPAEIIAAATSEDTQQIYQSIRLASPGGLGEVDSGDVAAAPEHSLLEAMQLAAERDLVAKQLAGDFAEVRWAADETQKWAQQGLPLADAIVATQLRLLTHHGDSLVARKLGVAASKQLSDRAAVVVAAHNVDLEGGGESYAQALADFDFWLRADGNKRNPGTTADLIAAALFVLLIENRLSWPVRFY